MAFKSVLSAELSLPFCLRLLSNGFQVWDPDPTCPMALILPYPHLGEISFSKCTTLVSSERLLWESAPSSPIPPRKMLMTCVTPTDEIPTLEITMGPQGGFRQLRAYTDIMVFVLLRTGQDPEAEATHDRVFATLNHFLDAYRSITQNPYVSRLDPKLDPYIVHYCTAELPSDLALMDDPAQILGNLRSLKFSHEIGKGRHDTCRMNTLEDVYPGRQLESQFLKQIVQAAGNRHDLPLHNELIFVAQRELKLRNYHVAILEAETSFEVFVASRLVELTISLGTSRVDAEAEIEKQFLKKRLKALDSQVVSYREGKGLPEVHAFVGSPEYTAWESDTYKMRNRITHEGWRTVTFDQAKAAISASKKAIRSIEERLPDFADCIQIYTGVEHLNNTAGRLQF